MIEQPVALTDLDDETATLILQLLQEDSQGVAIALVGKGKQAEGFETDAQMAMRLFIDEEIGLTETFVNDRRMTRSIQRAVQSDGDVCASANEQERIATTDRELSFSLSRGSPNTNDTSAEAVPNSTGDDEYEQLLQKLAYIYVDGSDNDEAPMLEITEGSDDDGITVDGDLPESSAFASSRRSWGRTKAQAARRQCNSCMETKHFTELARAPCKHEYCGGCLQGLFRTAMVDESFFPPRCCKTEIKPNDYNRLLLTKELVDEFAAKAVEYRTPNRTYCHDPTCAAFIPPTQYIDSVATCAECQLRTCTTCKREAHTGDCPNDLELQHVIEIAREEGWQRCQQCWSMVELTTGCNHMSCRCGFQFCYTCGAQWKSCGCEHWNEHRLYERAVQIDAREERPVEPIHDMEDQPAEVNEVQQVIEHQHEPGARHTDPSNQLAVDILDDGARLATDNTATGTFFDASAHQAQQRRDRIAAIMQSLRLNHECDHLRWRNKSGPGRCEECSDLMPVFIYECRQCHILACRRCKLHRL